MSVASLREPQCLWSSNCTMEKRGFPLWSLLPSEILWLIIDHLDFLDTHFVSAVCRNWRSARKDYDASRRHLAPNGRIPLLMITQNVYSSVREFYRPVANKTYKFDLSEFYGTSCLYSKDGWLLLHERDACGQRVRLVNIVTVESIDLPKLQHIDRPPAADYGDIHKATFSICSEYPNCVVLLIDPVYGARSKGGSIHVWKKGGNTWNTYTHPQYRQIRRIFNVWLCDDQVYYFSESGAIVASHSGLHTWRENISNKRIRPLFDLMAVCGNELFAVSPECSGEFNVYKFDSSTMEWVTFDAKDCICFGNMYEDSIGFMVRGKWTDNILTDCSKNHVQEIKMNAGSTIVFSRGQRGFSNNSTTWI